MNTTKCYRHGEICFEKIEKLPEGLEKSSHKEFLRGSHGNPHTYDNGSLYLKKEDDYIFGYFVAENTKLFHPEHGTQKDSNLKEAVLPDGIYRLRRQVEFISGELKQVID